MDPAKMKVVDLRNELASRGLDTKGNKAVLVKRLKDALEKELDHGLPDTSIADTSTEDIDTSHIEEADKDEDEQKSVGRTETSPEVSESHIVEKENQEDVDMKLDLNTEQKEAEANGENIHKTEHDTEETKEDEDDSVQVTISTKKESTVEEDQVSGNDKKDVKADENTETKGEKRKRDEEDVPEKKARSRSPIKEDEPEIDYEKCQLSWYDSDLHLQIDKQTFLSGKPLNDGAFGYIWAGARATYGITSGKVYYEVKITEELKWEDNIKRSEYVDRLKKSRYRTDHRNDKKPEKAKKPVEKPSETPPEGQQPSEPAEKMETDEVPDEKKENETVQETEAETAESKPEDEEKSEVETSISAPEASQEENAAENKEGGGETDQSKKDPESEPEPLPTHLFRVGYSLQGTSLQLGECGHSYGYESSGKFVSDKQFRDYGVKFGVGDVIGTYANIDSDQLTITYTVNGVLQAVAVTLPLADLPQNFSLFPHLLTRNYAFEVNFGDREETWFPSPAELGDYRFLNATEHKVAGPRRPDTRQDCEVILMVGLPASGKTHWVREHLKANPEKDFTVIGNSALLDRMTVCAEPLKTRFKGSWKTLIDKLHKCLNKITDIASQRRKNFVIDQTNLFPAAQRRKMRSFEGFKRRAVVIIVGDEEQAKRQRLQGTQDGKEVPESILYELKATMSIPQKEDGLDEIVYPELPEEEAKKMVKKYTEEARAKGYSRRFYRRDNRSGYNQNNYHDRNYQRQQPYGNRYPQGGGWGRQGGGGWERRDGRGPPPPPPRQGGGWRPNRPDRVPPRDYGRQGGPGSYARSNQPNYRSGGGSGGGRSGGGGWQQSGGWGGANGSGRQGGWNQQVFGGYGKWHQNDSGDWSYGNQSQSGGYGSQGQGRQNWNYYGQYGQQQGWGGGQQY
ncbi:heterogeneous nuclear ribonucleoprotein U-like protein 2 [Cylas formicarius]|uniref:heterogeneous nuclear ribonucleoprotein U-like protein 2 n=1 Tax=Cylas formicarius TaxID=197179 RepID=UPI0029589E28|nr:heterogeneous nuclear ribonucleoprotein U-like protein 2 [Cylas formicarius]